MQINNKILGKNQRFINFWTAEASYEDLKFFFFRHADVIVDVESSSTYVVDDKNMIKRDFYDEAACVENYCVRSKLVKMATETCELFCKAILLEHGKRWDELKNIGHNLLDCYNALPETDKLLIESIPLDYIMNYKQFYAIVLSMPYGVGEKYKDEYPDEYHTPLVDYLQNFATGKVLPNIQARYPGQQLLDFDEMFIVALAKLLYSFYKTKQIKNKEKMTYSSNNYPFVSLKENEALSD